MFKSLYILLILFVSLESKEIDLRQNYPSIGTYLSSYKDVNATKTFKEIRTLSQENFKPLKSDLDAQLFTSAAYWYTFTTKNTDHHKKVFSFGAAWLDKIDIYIIEESLVTHYKGGDLQDFNTRSYQDPKINFSHIFKNNRAEVYIRVETRDPYLVDISLGDEIHFLNTSKDFAIEMTFIFSVILAMLFYNFFIFLSSRDSTYLHYVIYLTGFLLMLSSYNGLLFQWFLKDYPILNNYSVVFFMNIYIITGIIFANTFLQTKIYHPSIYKFSKFAIFFFLLIAVLAELLGGYRFSMPISIINAALFSIYALSISFIAWRTDNHWARFFLLGSVSGFIGTMITAGTAISIIPYYHLTFKAIDYGVLLDALLLSFALAEKLKISQNQKLFVESKAKEYAQAAQKQKDDFLSNMSHELRTPLNAILGFIEILQKRIKEPTSLEYIDTIFYSTKTLINIINDVLDFSKLQKNELVLEKKNFDPKNEFVQTAALFKRRAEDEGIFYTTMIDDYLPAQLIGDVTRINQVLYNLLTNAFKFTTLNPHVELKIHYSNGFLTISVLDNGLGMTAENQEKIFNAFEQADISTTKKYAGTGLGLAICNKLILLMDAKLTLSSKVNEGSIFTLRIPLLEPAPEKEPEIKEETEEELQFKAKILVVEDNKTNQFLIQVLLEEYGIDFDIANDGLEALSWFKQEKYDLILMDENMPNMNGLLAFENIQMIESEKNLIPTPVVALTANVSESDKDKFLSAGMNDFLAKPLDYKELERVLLRFCQQI